MPMVSVQRKSLVGLWSFMRLVRIFRALDYIKVNGTLVGNWKIGSQKVLSRWSYSTSNLH